MAITLDIARDNPNAHTVSAEAVLPGEDKPTLIGLSREELGEALGTIGVPQKQWRMRASQLWHWLYVRGVSDFAQMTNIAKDLRQKLDEAFMIARPGNCVRADLRRRYPQVAVPLSRARRRPPGRG